MPVDYFEKFFAKSTIHPRVEFVHWKADDWVEVYIDGKPFYQGHSLGGLAWDKLFKRLDITFRETWDKTEGSEDEE